MDKINNNMCRCCASEGVFKDIRSKHYWMGEEEIYSDMLKSCFDITLYSGNEGDEGGICEVCVTQLRNAVNFKKQVLNTEEQFKARLNDKFMKNVKLEVSKNEGSDSDHNVSDELSSTDFLVPIKEELLEVKAKKRALKISTPRNSKKAKVELGESSTKRNCSDAPCDKIIERKITTLSEHQTVIGNAVKEEMSDWTMIIKNNKSIKDVKSMPRLAVGVQVEINESTKHIQNVRCILMYSNATPVKCDNTRYLCSFCDQKYIKPTDLKTHILERYTYPDNDEPEHSVEHFVSSLSHSKFSIKLDITLLQCKICAKNVDQLEQLIQHLKGEHSKEMYTDVKNLILPFKFDMDILKCVLCSATFIFFKHLIQHMNIHYRNYVCKICGAPFVYRPNLRCHMRRHKQGEFRCDYCGKMFDTDGKKRDHERFVHIGDCKRHKCTFCGEKFLSFSLKKLHMVQVHGDQPLTLKCLACDSTFTRRETLNRHVKRDHLMERRHECNECDMKFFARKELLNHLLKHSGEKRYKCDFCSKSFGRKYTLREHLRIHANDRRFKCERCEHAFVQKCSWKNHMRSKHAEIVR